HRTGQVRLGCGQLNAKARVDSKRSKRLRGTLRRDECQLGGIVLFGAIEARIFFVLGRIGVARPNEYQPQAGDEKRRAPVTAHENVPTTVRDCRESDWDLDSLSGLKKFIKSNRVDLSSANSRTGLLVIQRALFEAANSPHRYPSACVL